MSTAEWPLVGREEELALLEQAAGKDLGSVVVAGAVGVGKSRLVEEFLHLRTADQAGDQGGDAAGDPMRTVFVRATVSTATIPFGPFAPWAPERAGDAVATDRLEVLRSISRQLLSAGGPTVVAVDDAHLLDEGSAALVFHLASRQDVSAVLTVRSGEPCPDAVTALWKEELAERVDLQALSEPEIAELAEAMLGGRLAPSARGRLWTLTSGAPLYLREVVRAGVDQEVLTEAEGMWRWQGELAGSGRLVELVDRHLGRAGPEQRRALELLAVGEPLPVELLGELGELEAVTQAEERGYAVTEEGPEGLAVRLGHPLYGEVLRATMPRLTGRDYVRRLAAAAETVNWQERDPLRVASWWLDAGLPGDAQGSPEAFLAAATRAYDLGEWELAVRCAGAAEDTGGGARATMFRAVALVLIERWDEADELLTGLSEQALDEKIAAEVAVAHSRFLFWSLGQTVRALDVLTTAAENLTSPRRARVQAYGGYLAIFAGDLAEAVRLATAAATDAGEVVGLRVEALAVASLAWMFQGRSAAAVAAAEMVLPYAPAQLEIDPNPTAVLPAAYAMARLNQGRFDEAGRIAEATMHLAYADEVRIFRGLANTLAGRVALGQGRLDLATRWGSEGLAILRKAGLPAHWPTAVVVSAAAQLGDVPVAREALDWSDRAGPAAPFYTLELNLAQAWLAAAEGELSRARTLASEVATSAASSGACAYELTALLDVARLGAPDTVSRRLQELADVVDGAFAPAATAYVQALATRDGAALDAASERFEVMGAVLLAAEAAAEAAASHRNAGRRGSAITSITRARTFAEECGGARTPALRDIDAEPALATLTDREREVVQLAARGLTNREIAEHLFVSVRTVNTHLAHAYTKLGTNDRTELGALLGH